jgi:hypothetical protein
MPIPSRADQQLTEIDDLHGGIMVRLRVYRWQGEIATPHRSARRWWNTSMR